jgi:DNA-binding XRE family transcriptional regulator
MAQEVFMSDLTKYIQKRKQTDSEFADNFDAGYENFKLGILIKQARLEANLTQKELAQLLHTHKGNISRIENHSVDIKLSTLQKIAAVLGKSLNISFA